MTLYYEYFLSDPLLTGQKKQEKKIIENTVLYRSKLPVFDFWGMICCTTKSCQTVSSTTKIVPQFLFYHRKARRLSLRRTRITSMLNMKRGTCLNPIVQEVGRVVANFESQNVNIYHSRSSIFVFMFCCV